MPRKRLAKPPPGLPYGEGTALANSNSEVGAAIAPQAGQEGPAPIPQAPQPQPGLPDRVRVAGEAGPTPGVGLGEPTRFPNEPVTSGIPSGRGPGPEALAGQQRNTLFEFYSQLADATGDPFYVDLAMKSR